MMVRALSRRTVLGLLALGPVLPARAASPGSVNVVATTGMIADTAQTLGGEGATVRALMPPGSDPHAFRQTRSDLAALLGADLVLWNGLGLEAQMERLLTDLAARRPVVAVAEAIPADRLLEDEDYGRPDPHVWLDPALWSEASVAIAAALEEAGLPAAGALPAWQEELAALRDYADEVLATVPEESRILVTAHDAFRYWGRAHGWEVEGIQGISTESEAGIARIEELVSLLVERRIGAVFVESSVPDRNLRALIEGAAARGHEVVLGGTLLSDAMGPEGTYEGTYPGMIDHNATTIARALGGEAPERGRLGRLGS